MSDVLARVKGTAGRITLNRPHALNALTLEMVRTMTTALTEWATDPAVHLVLVDGAGERGLCAGGDIRALCDAAISGDLTSAATFFREEYRLNYLISQYPKPYVALMDGVVMGGGIGISAHASHRVVTERSVLAMPETAIGFAPDVGGTHLLANAPNNFGIYLGLTGDRMGAADAITCGFADIFISSGNLASLIEDLQRCDTRTALNHCLSTYGAPPPAGQMEKQREWINECYAKSSVENILAALTTYPNQEAHTAACEMQKHSPTSLKVTLHALRLARQYNNLRTCLQQEYCTSLACLRGPDFIEGVRAAIVDKDRNPRWNPLRLEEVDAEFVEQHFKDPGFEYLHLDI